MNTVDQGVTVLMYGDLMIEPREVVGEIMNKRLSPTINLTATNT